MIAHRFEKIGRSSWPILLVVLLVAAAAWGVYAWRFAGGPPEQAAEATPGVNDLPPTGLDRPPAVANLKATRPAAVPPAADTSGEPPSGPPPPALSGGVTPNAPPGRRPEIEISLADPPPPSPATALARLEAGRAAIAQGDLLSGRVALSAALAAGLSPADAAFARAECARIADAMLFSRATLGNDPLAGVHVVAGGETLNGIARQYGVSEALLMSINQINDPARLQAGRRLKVLHGPFHAVVDKAGHRMDVLLGEVVVRSYRVGLGTNGGTPTGTWVVRDKLFNPDWTDPATGRHYPADDPENPIGEHWIALDCRSGECLGRTGFGIHGTIEPESIGQNRSMGCVRLTPEDVAFLYDLLVAGRSTVVIR